MKTVHTSSHRRLVGELTELFQVDEQCIRTLLRRSHRPMPLESEVGVGLASRTYRLQLEEWMSAELREASTIDGRQGRRHIGEARDRLRIWSDVRQFRGPVPTEYFVG